jgi:hypothetical protein
MLIIWINSMGIDRLARGRDAHDMPISLLYVSNSLLDAAEEGPELNDVVAVARARNAALGVTGALVLARSHFAQVLEGERFAVDELMLSIRRDYRHTGINVVDVADISERRFTEWSMAYAGASTYVARQIAPLLPALQEAQRRTATIQRLFTLMQEFVADRDAGTA